MRVGNGAWQQRQLDIYGELLDSAARLPELLAGVEPETKRFLAGAWDRVRGWEQAREDMAAAIRGQGWSDAANAYTQAFGSAELDASSLLLCIAGFLPADDPRMLATIDAVDRHLTDDRGLVYRDRAADGLPGEEGTFLLCTFWLAQALALAGQTERARTIFDRAAGFATDLGLLAEEVSADGRELLGNFPQAFSHIGLVNAAWAIASAEQNGKNSEQNGENSEQKGRE